MTETQTKNTSTNSARVCQNCKQQFIIEPDDFAFYEKMNVPAPEICHECRSQERTAFRNESVLYKRKCDFSSKDIISIYSPDKPYKVYDQNVWWGDDWDAMEHGREYDFNRPFFEQFGEIFLAVPRLSIINRQSTNSDYCNYSNSNKNCYLCFGGHENEDCAYCWYNWKDKNCFDCLSVIKSELTYESNFGSGLYRCAFLEYSFDCVECYFGHDLRGCQNCFFSTNLRNKQHYFLNQPLSKEEYEARIKEFWNGSYAGIEKARKLLEEEKLKGIRNPLFQRNCTNCSGGDIMYSKNIQFGFDGEYSEDSKYVYPKFTNVYNCMDTNKMGYDRSDWSYMAIGCAGLNNSKFCDTCWNNHDLTYCNLCFSSGNLFGCVGLKHKQYCILNKQYSEEEYKALTPKIFVHMQSTGEWGKFFPAKLSPFTYNETTAQEYTPITRAEAVKLGYFWKEPETKGYKPTLQTADIPDAISQANDAIAKEMIACAHAGPPNPPTGGGGCDDQCTVAFRITAQELQFYRHMNLPLPRLCPNCRHHKRLHERNPLKLWHRQCQCAGMKSENAVYTNTISHRHHHDDAHCPNEFETTYAPNRPEIVYCESCYNAEVV